MLGPVRFRKCFGKGDMVFATEACMAYRGRIGKVLKGGRDLSRAEVNASPNSSCWKNPYTVRFEQTKEAAECIAQLFPHEIERLERGSASEFLRGTSVRPGPETSTGRQPWSGHWIQEVNMLDHLPADHAAGHKSQAERLVYSEGVIFEACIQWHPKLAGRLWDLPATTAAEAARLGLKHPIRFLCPDEHTMRGGWLVLFVRLPACDAETFELPRLVPAPWAASRRHWRLGEHWGTKIVTSATASRRPSSPIPSARSRASRQPTSPASATSSSTLPEVAQRDDGTLVLRSQCTAGGGFASVLSTHLMDLDGWHQFVFGIARCANLGTGLRVGVASPDGKRQWTLRLSDCRLCDQSGGPLMEVLREFNCHVLHAHAACHMSMPCATCFMHACIHCTGRQRLHRPAQKNRRLARCRLR